MSSFIEGDERQQNYPVHIQDNGLTVIENVYSDSANNERERPVTVILLFIKSCITSHTEELIAMRKLLK